MCPLSRICSATASTPLKRSRSAYGDAEPVIGRPGPAVWSSS